MSISSDHHFGVTKMRRASLSESRYRQENVENNTEV